MPFLPLPFLAPSRPPSDPTPGGPTQRRRGRLMQGLGLALLPWLAAAQTPPAPPPAGRLLASNCAQCHGTNGKGPGFERLAGESAREIYEEMKEMQAGKEGKGLMSKHALGYSDAQLRLLADYLSKQR